MLAQQDEITRLKKQKDNEIQTHLDRIEELENELEETKTKLKDKTEELDTSEMRIADLSAQIMELHKKAKQLETELLRLKQTSADKIKDLEKKLTLKGKQLQDSQDLFKDSNAKNFELLMDVADLRSQLTQSQTKASKTDEITAEQANKLTKQLKTQEKETRKLENKNQELKEEIKELKLCCADVKCDDLQRQLAQSQEDANRLQQQLHEKDANFNRQQQELEDMKKENNKLQDKYNSLANEKNTLQDTVEDLRNKLNDVDDNTVYPIKVALDPNTAHARVLLSADNTAMSIVEEPQNVPDHPGRFNVALAALGKTGFTSGRHYWEVSVAGRLCYHLGMASESSKRKGIIVARPSNGFWTLTMNKQGQYRALDMRPASIPVQVPPATLGILLDYKKGQISFYDAVRRDHIYSFVGQKFTNKIYPFINGCVDVGENESPLVLTAAGSVEWIQ
ncbi:uncharacterized protein LOC144542175 [Centroberyx gerrardi]